MRLIDADELKERLRKQSLSSNREWLQMDLDLVIDNAPTVDLKDIYQEGHYDGHREGYEKAINEERPKAKDDLSCQYCKYDDKASTEYPCTICKNNHPNMFEWKEDKK